MSDVTITFTLQGVLWACGALCSVAAAVAVIYKVFRKALEPEETQTRRIEALESQVVELKKFLATDKDRLDAVDEGNRITQEALLALLSHAINGNDIESLTKAKKDLQAYLIKK